MFFIIPLFVFKVNVLLYIILHKLKILLNNIKLYDKICFILGGKLMKNSKNNNFANGYGFYKLFWIFLIGCIAGVIVETLWCLFTTHHIESITALVIGPFNPIYGFGAVLMTLIYIILKNKNNFVIFITCSILGGLFESLCSYIQELLFGTVSWYYESDSLGILGQRTSIVYCLF